MMQDIVQLIAITVLSGMYVWLGWVNYSLPAWLERKIDFTVCTCMTALFLISMNRVWWGVGS